VSAAKRKTPAASADTQAQTPAANCGRVTVDRAQFAEVFRQLAAKSNRAADEAAAVARMLTTAAEKLETPPAANTPRTATGKARP
jgi:hypothetical protein